MGSRGLESCVISRGKISNLPVIIYTAYDSYLDHTMVSKADGYVIKSVVLDELKEKIAAVLEQKWVRETALEAKPCSPEPCPAHIF